MNHGLKLHPDGTLEITMPKGKKVGRVLVCEAGTQNGSLYYPERDVPDTNVGDMISRQAAIDLIMGQPPEAHYPSWYAEQIKGLPSAQPEIIQWETCFDCPLSHGCPVINGCTNEQAMEYAGEIPDNCPLNKISTEPERKKGEWIKQDCGGVEYTAVCSECGYGTFWSDASDFNFCPNCGCQMNGGEQDGDE